ncbi:hypothetical protein FIBSPDRAFT_754773, partial [Athelia psychrophila]
LIYARLLGYLMLESPSDESRDYITYEIIRCDGDNDRMNRLAKLYQDHLLRPFEEERLMYSSPVEPAPNDHTQAKKAVSWLYIRRRVKIHSSKTLRRDGYRCMVTGVFDGNYCESLSPVELQATSPLPSATGPTNACYIFPLSMNMDLEPEEEGHPTTHDAGTVWGIIGRFSGIWIEDELNGEKLHRLSNIMTMTMGTRAMFDGLSLWFEENTLDTYNVCATLAGILINLPPVVTFATTDPALALPDKRYLKLHAIVCRVAWMSGASEYMRRYDAEHEERKFLARDGSSAEFLTTKLQRAVLAR